MPSDKQPVSDRQGDDLTPEEIKQTFHLLGLDDPATRERLLRLANVAEQQQQTVGTWMTADSGTGYLE